MKKKKNKLQIHHSPLKVIPITERAVVSRCLYCKIGYRWPANFEIPPYGHPDRNCRDCNHPGVQFYEGRSKHLKGGAYKMVDPKSKPAAKKEKTSTSKKEKGAAKGYNDDVKAKAVTLAKQGKTLSEIEKTLNGPKKKAIMRYLDAAKVEITK